MIRTALARSFLAEPNESGAGDGPDLLSAYTGGDLTDDDDGRGRERPECNVLVADDLDPRSKIPGFKYTAVALAPADVPV